MAAEVLVIPEWLFLPFVLTIAQAGVNGPGKSPSLSRDGDSSALVMKKIGAIQRLERYCRIVLEGLALPVEVRPKNSVRVVSHPEATCSQTIQLVDPKRHSGKSRAPRCAAYWRRPSRVPPPHQPLGQVGGSRTITLLVRSRQLLLMDPDQIIPPLTHSPQSANPLAAPDTVSNIQSDSSALMPLVLPRTGL